MLFTRCPDCDTTFRVTDDALKKANGQVRCGRCASVFNAYAERQDPPPELAAEASSDDAAEPTPKPLADPGPDAPEPSAAQKSPALPSVKIALPAPAPWREAASGIAGQVASNSDPAAAENAALSEQADDALESISVADVVAQIEIGEADASAEKNESGEDLAALTDTDSISPEQVDEVLASDDPSVRTWHLGEARTLRFNPRAWAIGVAVAVVALGAQGLHHYRADLATSTSIGPLVQGTYEIFGATVVPRWDVKQYEIIDWVATAEPNTRGRGSLRIAARIRNRGPMYQPYPSVHLRLKDRWEETVGSRVFAPHEYLAAAPRKLMAPGETTRAELEIVDPGQDAYGFELDVCIEVETRELSCGSDKVFL